MDSNIGPLVQETIVATSGSALRFYVLRFDRGPEVCFLSEIIYPPVSAGDLPTCDTLSARFSDPTDAFRALVAKAVGYAKRHGVSIASSDNPCNCPFVDAKAQALIWQEAGAAVAVNVNGRPS